MQSQLDIFRSFVMRSARVMYLPVILLLASPANGCPGSFYNGIDWYLLLTKSAIIKTSPSTPFTASTLYSYVQSDITFAGNTILNTNLMPSMSACGNCALTYANSVLAIRVAGSMASSCFQAGNTWSKDDTIDLLAPGCVNSIQTSLTAFNQCSDVTYSLLTGMPVEKQCTYPDFLDIDAQYHSYGTMMSFALNLTTTSKTNIAPFMDAIKTVTCGNCFTSFMESIVSAKSLTSVGYMCSASGIYTSACQNIPEVREAIVKLRNCVGGYDMSNLSSAPSLCTPNEKLLLTKAYNVYEPIVECSVDTDPRGSGAAAWFECMRSKRIEFGQLISTTLTCRGCLLDFGSFVKTHGSASCDSVGPYSPACIASTASARTAAYICSGFKINTAPANVTCPAAYLTNLDPRYLSYVPMMEMASEAPGDLEKAVGMFFNQSLNGPLLSVTSYMPCRSCYPSLAADLAYVFENTPQAVADCASFYKAECMTSPAVASALQEFQACAGFTLENTSPYVCLAHEIDSIQRLNIPRYLYYGMFGLGVEAVSPREIAISMKAEFQNLKSQSPGTNTLMCERCFVRLHADLELVDSRARYLCKSIENIPICFYEIGFQLQRFAACAGFDFDFSQPPVSQVSLVSPVLNTNQTQNTSNFEELNDVITEDSKGSPSNDAGIVASLMYLILFT